MSDIQDEVERLHAGGAPEKIWRVWGHHSCQERFFYAEGMAGRALALMNNEPARMDCYVPRKLLGKAEAEIAILRSALEELADLMDDVHSGDYKPDSFTTQPARNALSRLGPYVGGE